MHPHMSDSTATPNGILAKEIHNVMLTEQEIRNAKQCPSDGTTPVKNGASGDNPVNASATNTAQKNWSEEVKEGVAPYPKDDQEDDGESSDESSDDDSSSDEEIKAPLELLGEFLQYIRTSDWENAAKLCKMILIYEPANPEALQFQTAIAEKAQIEKELAEMSSSSDDDDDEESTTTDEDSEEDTIEEPGKNESKDDDSSDEFEPRPGSIMKNKLVFPNYDPVWRP